ncbi:MAG: hypothetical protein E7219_05915 [Clostridiales bacterium]|jgi:GH25 family lysozyme M1 (1,4-beta-N-acetylmuramidase)|nr:hypothetical protein [Clostridiales bacterium]
MNRKPKNGLKRFASGLLIMAMTIGLASGFGFVGESSYAGDFGSGSPYSSTGRSTYYHNGRYASSVLVNGVDISDWQSKNCDFGAARNAGVDFAIMRVTWSGYGRGTLKTRTDDNFAYQYSNAKANGVMTGVYVFSQATNVTEAVQEANFAINRLRALGIGPKDLQLPVYMDYEFAGGILGRMYGLKRTAASNAAAAFCNTIKSAGYTPGIYASTDFFNKYIDTSQLAADVDLWCAQYYSRCQYGGNYSKWQYSSSAKIDGMLSYLGFKGSIDADFWYINKNVNGRPQTTIQGRNVLSVAEAKNPHFRITYNGQTLQEGVHYNVGTIRTNKTGQGYAYIKGIAAGGWSGYALVPLTVAGSSSGDANQNLNGVSANYLTAGAGGMSAYDAPAAVNISVPKTKIRSLNGKKKAFKIKVSKKSKSSVSGYEVRYSRRKDMKESDIKTVGTKYNKTSKKISTNARKRNYWVQVRCYRDYAGVRYYSKWSAKKKVRVR